jgi:hypothetical protein
MVFDSRPVSLKNRRLVQIFPTVFQCHFLASCHSHGGLHPKIIPKKRVAGQDQIEGPVPPKDQSRKDRRVKDKG